MNSNKLIVIVSGVIIFLLILGCVSSNSNNDSKKLEKVSVRFPIPFVEAGQTPFYVALNKGYYAEEGLDVTFNHGSPELNPVKMILTKSDEFGLLGGPDTLLVARGKSQPLKAIAVFHKNANFVVLLSLKKSGLTKVEDLQGKKVGFYYGHISTDILHALFNKEKISVQEVDVGYNYSQLVSGQIDAQFAFRPTAGIDLPEKGIEINSIDPKDYGVSSHGYTLFAREDFIEKNPKTTEKFLRATLKGLKYSVNYPKESIEILAKYDAKINENIELKRLHIYNEPVSKNPYGFMDTQMFQETYDRLLTEKVVEKPFNVDDAFDTSFVNKLNIRD